MNPTLSPSRIRAVLSAAESDAGEWFRFAGLTATEAGYAIAAVTVAGWPWGPEYRATPVSQRAIAKAFYGNPRLARRAIDIMTTAREMRRVLT